MMMVTAQQVTLTTMMTMATARWDTTTTTMATDVDDKDDKGNDASSTGCDEGDNRNRDDGKDTCASPTATAQHVVRRWPVERRRRCKEMRATTSWRNQRGGVKDGRVRQLRDER